jgi:predicted flap endonuclease-1-like 5' DNA nuclease
MGYVFGKALGWMIAVGVLGAIIGWFANGWGKKRSATQSWSSTSATTELDEELSRLRARNANLEPIVADRDSLRVRIRELETALSECEAAKSRIAAPVAAIAGIPQGDYDGVVADRERLRGLLGDHESTIADLRARLDAQPVGIPQGDFDAVVAERNRLQGLIGEHESTITGHRSLLSGHESTINTHVSTIASLEARLATPVNRFAGFDLDLDRASRVLGERIKMDDLKVVEGIGPKIEELCHAGGITTWAGLADTPVSRLQEILDSAGERYRIHNPSTWPKQSGLLALGRWDEFKELIEGLTAGRE